MSWTVTLVNKQGQTFVEVVATDSAIEAQTTAEALFECRAVRIESAE